MSEPERRRHPRRFASLQAWVDMPGGRLTGTLVDVSAGGLLLELPAELSPPRLGTRGRATLIKDGVTVQRNARVVRARLAGRERGTPMPKACAFVFDDGDDDAERTLDRLLGPV